MYVFALKLRRQPKDVRACQFHGVKRDVLAWRDRIAVEGSDFCVLATPGDVFERDRLDLDGSVTCCQMKPQNCPVAVLWRDSAEARCLRMYSTVPGTQKSRLLALTSLPNGQK